MRVLTYCFVQALSISTKLHNSFTLHPNLPICSPLRTISTKCPGIAVHPGSREQKVKRDGVVRASPCRRKGSTLATASAPYPFGTIRDDRGACTFEIPAYCVYVEIDGLEQRLSHRHKNHRELSGPECAL